MLFNYRGGFACNSSSSHSLLLLPPGVTASDDLQTPREFGWENFVAASKESKRDYLALLLMYAVQEKAGKAVALSVAKDWLGVDLHAGVEGDDREPFVYIDHQSIMAIPEERGWGGKGPHKEFFKDLTAFFDRDDVAILGGNDNDDGGEHFLATKAGVPPFRLPLAYETTDPIWCRKDPVHGFWVVFNPQTGGKARFSFADPTKPVPMRSSLPELVDVKITDFCPYGCEYCYQGSTTQGKHAPKEEVEWLMSALAELGVFEVALGGGEPTLHPEFFDFLGAIRRRGIVPNFTTRNLGWLTEPEKVKAVEENVGAIAMSVNVAADVHRLSGAIAAAGHKVNGFGALGRRFKVQYVIGAPGDLPGVMCAARETGFDVTLLGYKRVGFAKNLAALTPPWGDWLDLVKSLAATHACPKISIDTPLAAERAADILLSDIPEWCFTTREGAFSMYVDAVAHKCGPSSYEPEAMVDLDLKDVYRPEPLPRRIHAAFNKFAS